MYKLKGGCLNMDEDVISYDDIIAESDDETAKFIRDSAIVTEETR